MRTQPALERGRRRPPKQGPAAIVELLERRPLLATVTVDVINFAFNPTPVMINVGDTVHWVWESDDHSSTSVAGSLESWDSGVVNTGATFDHTFTHAGMYVYYCKIHGQDNGNGTASGMSGSIMVMSTSVTLQSIAVTPTNSNLVVGQTQQFMAMGMFSDHSTMNISSQVNWTSSTPAAATINAAGLATGVAPGTSTISAAFSGVTGTTALHVTATPPPVVESIVLTPVNSTVAPGQTEQFKATGILADNSTTDVTSEVTWTSSSASVATISTTGLAKGVAQGKSTISAALNGVSGTTGLTVAFPSFLTKPRFTTAGLKIQAMVNKTHNGYVAYFNEPNTRTTGFHALIDWGDDTKQVLGHIHKRSGGHYAVIGSHRYVVRGNYPVTVTIKDALGRKVETMSEVRAVL